MSELFDPGLQSERTDLAWRRTALAYLVDAALLARFARGTPTADAAFALSAALALAGALALAHAGRLYPRRSADLRAGRPAARPAMLRALQLITTAACLGALALAVRVLA